MPLPPEIKDLFIFGAHSCGTLQILRSFQWPQKVIRHIKRKYPSVMLNVLSNSCSGSFRSAYCRRLEKHHHVPVLFLYSSLSISYCSTAAANYQAKWIFGVTQCSCSCKWRFKMCQINKTWKTSFLQLCTGLIQRETIRGVSKSLKNQCVRKSCSELTGQTCKSHLRSSLPAPLCRGLGAGVQWREGGSWVALVVSLTITAANWTYLMPPGGAKESNPL